MKTTNAKTIRDMADDIYAMSNPKWNPHTGCGFMIRAGDGTLWDIFVPPYNARDAWCIKHGTHGLTRKTFARVSIAGCRVDA